MKTFFIISIILIAVQFAISQETYSSKNVVTNSPVEELLQVSVPQPPSISGYLDRVDYKTYRFIANSYGATEYEWHIAGPGGMIKSIEYPLRDEALVYFNYGSSTPIQVVCRAKNENGWSEYTVTFHTITF